MQLRENVISLSPWEVYKFSWGSAVKKRNGKWIRVFIAGQEVNVENVEIVLHENGIEFL